MKVCSRAALDILVRVHELRSPAMLTVSNKETKAQIWASMIGAVFFGFFLLVRCRMYDGKGGVGRWQLGSHDSSNSLVRGPIRVCGRADSFALRSPEIGFGGLAGRIRRGRRPHLTPL
jgi:hypothetical protein